MFDDPSPLAPYTLFAFSLSLAILRTWVEVRGFLNKRRARQRREAEAAADARDPPPPAPPFDPVAYEQRRQELIAAGWREWVPGIFTQDPQGTAAPTQKKD